MRRLGAASFIDGFNAGWGVVGKIGSARGLRKLNEEEERRKKEREQNGGQGPYTSYGQTFENAPNEFETSVARNNAYAQVYDRWGMADEARSVRAQALDEKRANQLYTHLDKLNPHAVTAAALGNELTGTQISGALQNQSQSAQLFPWQLQEAEQRVIGLTGQNNLFNDTYRDKVDLSGLGVSQARANLDRYLQMTPIEVGQGAANIGLTESQTGLNTQTHRYNERANPINLDILQLQRDLGLATFDHDVAQKAANVASTRAGTRNTNSQTAGQDIQNTFNRANMGTALDNERRRGALIDAQVANLNSETGFNVASQDARVQQIFANIGLTEAQTEQVRQQAARVKQEMDFMADNWDNLSGQERAKWFLYQAQGYQANASAQHYAAVTAQQLLESEEYRVQAPNRWEEAVLNNNLTASQASRNSAEAAYRMGQVGNQAREQDDASALSQAQARGFDASTAATNQATSEAAAGADLRIAEQGALTSLAQGRAANQAREQDDASALSQAQTAQMRAAEEGSRMANQLTEIGIVAANFDEKQRQEVADMSEARYNAEYNGDYSGMMQHIIPHIADHYNTNIGDGYSIQQNAQGQWMVTGPGAANIPVEQALRRMPANQRRALLDEAHIYAVAYKTGNHSAIYNYESQQAQKAYLESGATTDKVSWAIQNIRRNPTQKLYWAMLMTDAAWVRADEAGIWENPLEMTKLMEQFGIAPAIRNEDIGAIR